MPYPAEGTTDKKCARCRIRPPLIRLFVIASVKICSNMLVCLFTSGDVLWNGGFRFTTIPPMPHQYIGDFRVLPAFCFRGESDKLLGLLVEVLWTVSVFGGYLELKIQALTTNREVMHRAVQCSAGNNFHGYIKGRYRVKKNGYKAKKMKVIPLIHWEMWVACLYITKC